MFGVAAGGAGAGRVTAWLVAVGAEAAGAVTAGVAVAFA